MAKKERKQKPNESLDSLLRKSQALRSGEEFQKFLDFISKFKEYKPFNNMLVYTQNPACTYYATEAHYKKAFKRTIKEEARPMVILAPMHPVLFVFDVKDTEGDDLPEQLSKQSYEVFGYAKEDWFTNVISYFADLKISAREYKMQDTKGGSISRKNSSFTIEINSNHDVGVKLSTLIHELGHLFLGHLGSMDDEKFPLRGDLSKKIKEIEAEAVSYIVLQRFGLESNAHEYLAFYNARPDDLHNISVDLVIKIAGKIENMLEKPNKKK